MDETRRKLDENIIQRTINSLFYFHISLFLAWPLCYCVGRYELLVGIIGLFWFYYKTWQGYFQKYHKAKYGTPTTDSGKDIMNIVVSDRIQEMLGHYLTTLGLSLTAAVGLYLQSGNMYQLGLFIISLAAYHLLEYLFVLLYHFKDIKFDSFLINQGKHYTFAMTFSFWEYFYEYTFYPGLKENSATYLFVIIGAIMVIIGQCFRAGAEFTAKSNFTHHISYRKKNSHELITHGVYSFSRHPGYFGWFLWSVSSQIMIINPVWIVGFFFVSYYFFKDRIVEEEDLLKEFFGYDYIRYQQKVPTRIPFID